MATHVSGANREEEIGPRGAGDWLHEVLGVFGGGAVGAEALLIAGGGVRFAGALTACEAQTGLPVVTGPAALVRAAIRTLACQRIARVVAVCSCPQAVARSRRFWRGSPPAPKALPLARVHRSLSLARALGW